MHVKRMLGERADDECKEGINYASGGDGTIPKTAPERDIGFENDCVVVTYNCWLGAVRRIQLQEALW